MSILPRLHGVSDSKHKEHNGVRFLIVKKKNNPMDYRALTSGGESAVM
jgi:hypothetical protein